jgi:hypothetical protein
VCALAALLLSVGQKLIQKQNEERQSLDSITSAFAGALGGTDAVATNVRANLSSCVQRVNELENDLVRQRLQQKISCKIQFHALCNARGRALSNALKFFK